LWRRG
jgi:hypothetical protein